MTKNTPSYDDHLRILKGFISNKDETLDYDLGVIEAEGFIGLETGFTEVIRENIDRILGENPELDTTNTQFMNLLYNTLKKGGYSKYGEINSVFLKKKPD